MSRVPDFYVPPFGTPLYWRDEITGVLPGAVQAYFAFKVDQGPALSADQLVLLIDYVQYHINAPCWADPARDGTLDQLRVRAKTLVTVEDIDAYIWAALEIGLDPF